MGDCTVKRLEEMESTFGGAMRKVRGELGVTAFGIQVFDMPPNVGDRYPEHDHQRDGQEEVYVVLRGSGEIEIDGDTHALDPETLVRVGPASKRTLRSGPEGMRVLALGATPGKVYEPPQFTQLGAPDPAAQQP
jgi:mannose-6-phosphate isomerase-like protein (cupin superfamily)